MLLCCRVNCVVVGCVVALWCCYAVVLWYGAVLFCDVLLCRCVALLCS